MSAAQAAQQHNRTTDGRYAERSRAEAGDLGLNDAKGDAPDPVWLVVSQDGATVQSTSYPSVLLRDRALVRLSEDYRLDVAEAAGRESQAAPITDRERALAYLAEVGGPNGVSVQLTAPA